MELLTITTSGSFSPCCLLTAFTIKQQKINAPVFRWRRKMPKPRLAPALQVFQTLQRYPIIRPRTTPDVPIGCKQDKPISAETAQQCLQSLYHDLGILVFAGSNVKQTERIGDILRQAVAWGGPGGMATRLHWLTTGESEEYEYERIKEPRGQDLHDTVDESRPGQIKSGAVISMASSRLEKLLRERIGKAQPKLGKLHLQETQVLVPGSPAPSGAILPTDTGPRTLPLESYASLWFNSDTGHAVGLVQLFTIGTGAYVGGARIEYKMSWFEDGERQAARSFESDSQSGRKMELGSKMQNERLGEVRIRVLEPLWELEREVWAHRAADLGK